MKRGIYINLDTSEDRKKSLLGELSAAGFDASSYCRFSAIRPLKENIGDIRGLNSIGELGLWMSMVGVFRMICKNPFDEIIHVIEDDMTFSANAGEMTSMIADLMTSKESLRSVDIIFLDYFMSAELCRAVVPSEAHLDPRSISFLDASKYYLACTSSFLVRRSSAAYISVLLGRILESASSLLSVDITLRSLIRLGALKAALVAPPIGAPSWRYNTISTIQEETFPEVRKTQRAYLLLRQLASGIRSPYWCAENLASLYGITNPVSNNGSHDDFLAYFCSVESQMTPF